MVSVIFPKGTDCHVKNDNCICIAIVLLYSTARAKCQKSSYSGNRSEYTFVQAWCNILICHHFPVVIRDLHKWNTHLCTPPWLYSRSFRSSMYCITQGHKEWGKCLHLHLLGDRILSEFCTEEKQGYTFLVWIKVSLA